ncbi:MAG: transposase [Sumerlaeia bacterium]
MARTARVIAVRYPHHVLQRGNFGAPVFMNDEDRSTYLERLRTCAKENKLEVLAYCLMQNHIHIVAVPKQEESLAMALRRTHSFYSRYLNSRLDRVGHVWQNRFYSCPVDKDKVWPLVKYVEQNPVRAGLVKDPWEYRWSSAPAHCGLTDDPLLAKNWPPKGAVEDWKAFLKTDLPEDEVEAVRRSTIRGQVWGGKAFIERLEKKLERPVGPRRIGRPPKADKSKRPSP